MRWSKSTLILAAVAALLFATTITGAYFTFKRGQDAAGARQMAVQAARTAEEAIEYADSVEAAAAAEVARARTTETKRIARAPATSRIIAESPDVCKPVVDALTADIADLTVESKSWQTAFEKEKEAAGKLKPATSALIGATTDLVEATKPSFFARLVPKVGVGGAAGVSAIDRRPDVVIGITLAWEL